MFGCRNSDKTNLFVTQKSASGSCKSQWNVVGPKENRGVSVGSTTGPQDSSGIFKGLVVGIPDPFENFHVTLVVTSQHPGSGG